jgi:hypothetical protein
MTSHTKASLANLAAGVTFFAFSFLFIALVNDLESRFGAFCTPALIAAGMSALCMAFGAFCFIRPLI